MADRSVTVRLLANVAQFKKEMRDAEGTTNRTTDALKRQDTQMVKQEKTIDRFSGRLRLFAEAGATIGPAFVPITAAAVPALAGLTAGIGAAVGALGVAMLAFHGMGDALKALDAYHLEPTTANLEKMQATLDQLGPAGADFARYLYSLGPALEQLQAASQDGFPGIQQGIEELLPLLPQVEEIVSNISVAMGELAADAGQGLNNERFQEFFDYLESDAGPTVLAFGHALGNLGEGLASLMVGFAPLSRDFSAGFEEMTRSFADWAAGLSETDGFREFVAYVRESGPQALDALGSIATALIAVVKAAAPFGQAVLPALTALADVLAAVADSPIGPALFTAAAALIAVNRVLILTSTGFDRLSTSMTRTSSSSKGAALGIAGIAAAVTILGNELAKATGAKLDLGDLNRDLDALANGSNTELLNRITSDLAILGDTSGKVAEPIKEAITAFGLFGNTNTDNAAENINQVDEALASLVESGQAEKAAALFAKIQEARTGLSADTHQFAPFGESAKTFDAYATALGNASAGTHEYAAADSEAAEAAARTRTEIRGLVAAMEEQTSAALGAFDAVTQYGQALDAANDAAAKGKRGIDENTEAGRENRDALSGLAAAWNNQSDAVRNNVGRFQDARKAFIDTATAMGVPIKRARDLANQLMEIPKSVVTQVTADTDNANANLNVLYGRLAELRNTSTTTYIDVVTRSFNAKRAGIPGGPKGSADGGTVPFGGPYVDKHSYLLAPGEEVVSDRFGQATKNRGALKAANRGAKLAVVGYANGGTVGNRRGLGFTATPPSAAGSGLTLDDRVAIASALQQIRDLSRDLSARVKKGDHKGELVTRGIDRQVMELQLQAARHDLKAAKTREAREARQAQREKTREQVDKMKDARDAALDRAQGVWDDIKGARDDLAGSVKSGLTSDIWAERDSNLPSWLAAGQKKGPADPLAALREDIAKAQEFSSLETGLAGRGLTGGAFEEATKNGGLAGLRILGGYTDAELAEYSSLFAKRDQETTSAGSFAGNEVYGQQMVAQSQEMNRIAEEFNAEMAALRRELNQQSKKQDKAPALIGAAVGAAVGAEINAVSTKAAQGRPKKVR